jgi:predicted enzyme related to lactoylglutathione lyase
MNQHEKINYLELPANDLNRVKNFFETVFNWSFQDYGKEYTAFSDGTINGGFYQSDLSSSTQSGATLVVFYSQDLTTTQEKIEQAGGKIIQPTFSFPGGRRFHFADPANNEYAVWSDK